MHDGGNGVEEGQPFLSCRANNALRQRCRRQRAGCDDSRTVGGEGVDPLAHDRDVGMIFQRALHFLREDVAVHGHGRSGRHACNFARAHDERIQISHLVMQQADGILLVIVGAEGIGAHEFGETIRLVSVRRFAGSAHFRQAYLEAAPRQLPRRFAAGETAADDMDIVCHG